MRILYLTDRLSLRGGADQHLLQVIADTDGAGHEVTVAFGRRDPHVALSDRVSTARVRGLASPVATTSRLADLEAMLAGSDVVHVQNVMNPVALRLAVSTGRAVVTVQDHRVFCPGMGKTLPGGKRCLSRMSDQACAACLPDDAYRRRTLELTEARLGAIAGARRVAVLSRFMARELDAAGLPGALVLPPWVDVGDVPPEPGSGFVVGGRLVTHKGVLDARDAWRMAGSGHPLLVAGAGPLESSLEVEGVIRLGWLGRDELRRTLHGARALLLPSAWQEPFGILGVEALAEGTPVVLADSGGTSEWSDAGCIRVPPGDIGATAVAIRRLADDDGLALELGRAGMAMVAARFSRAAIVPRVAEVYREVAVRERDDRPV